MPTPRCFLLLLAVTACFQSLAGRRAEAGNGDELTNVARHHHVCRYGDPRACSCNTPHHGCRDCQMSWQPIRSRMHPNMLPAGMLRPWPPINRMIHKLIPSTPQRWLQPGYPWTGCKDGNCFDDPGSGCRCPHCLHQR